MNLLPLTLLAFFFNSIAVTVDKVLLTKTIQRPIVYVFYISLVSLLALLLLPFTHLPSWSVFFLASASTLVWTTGLYFLYKGLQVGQVSRVVPVIGTLVPLLLLVYASLNKTLSTDQTWAAGILVVGLVILTLPDWKGKITTKELTFEVLAAIFFAHAYLLLRQAYLQDNFLTVWVYSRVILVILAGIILLVPSLRRLVLTAKKGPKFKLRSKTGLLFALGQFAGGSQELLLTFSISLANPALVNSLQGSQYVFLFILALILSKKYPHIFKEHLTKFIILAKIIGILVVGLGLFILAQADSHPVKAKPELGLTFSPKYAKSLGLNPKETFMMMTQDLKVKKIRLPVYWDEVETVKGDYNFSEVDYYLKEGSDLQFILVLGAKQPRWPECF